MNKILTYIFIIIFFSLLAVFTFLDYDLNFINNLISGCVSNENFSIQIIGLHSFKFGGFSILNIIKISIIIAMLVLFLFLIYKD